jgi:hypothetical protein
MHHHGGGNAMGHRWDGWKVGALAIGILATSLWLRMPAPAHADPGILCVRPGGTGCAGECGGCYATVQGAVDGASPGDEIRIAGDVYAPGGTVATITKRLTLRGAYSPDLSTFDPDAYETVLDAQRAGSVIHITSADAVYLQHLTLTHGNGDGNCGIQGCGGGVYSADTDIYVSECLIADNIATTSGGSTGGGIYAHAPAGIVEIWNSRIISNTASASSTEASQYGPGGGLYVAYGAVTLRRNTIQDNVGSVVHSGSGGIRFQGVTSATVTANTIAGNKACLGDYWCAGGGMEISDSSQVLVADNHIEGNWAADKAGYGGGVYVYLSDVHMTGNTIVGNTTGEWHGHGGGVAILSTIPVTLSNNVIAHNEAGTDGGGVSVIRYGAPASEAVLVNNTIAHNGDTGIAATGYASITLRNNIVVGHTTGITETEAHPGTPPEVTIAADTNLFWNSDDPIVGASAIRENPRLRPNLSPSAGSPAIDAGLDIPWLATDIAGNPRVPGAYDIGAFEWLAEYLHIPVAMRRYP